LTEVPMAAPGIPEFAGIVESVGDCARRTGMRYRPLSDTVHDTWLWLKHGAAAEQAPATGASLLSLGLDPNTERKVLAALD
jgi:2'-hydroxyisoflavone reductase